MNGSFLVVVDFDVIHRSSDAALGCFAEFVAAHRERLELVYVTKVHFGELKEKIAARPVPEPTAVIAGMGSEVCSYPDGQLDQGWANRMSAHWSTTTVQHVLAGEASAPLDPEEMFFPFMVSCQLDDTSDARIGEIEYKLAHAGIDAYCVRGSANRLHVLPRGVDVGAAAAFVARQLAVPQQRVIVAGDSVFDARLFEHGFYGIVLSDDARVAADSDIDSMVADEQVYVAQRRYAEGLCEGLQYWFDHLAETITTAKEG